MKKAAAAAAGSINEGRFCDTEKDDLSLTMTLLALPQPGKGQVTKKVNIDVSYFGFIAKQLFTEMELAIA